MIARFERFNITFSLGVTSILKSKNRKDRSFLFSRTFSLRNVNKLKLSTFTHIHTRAQNIEKWICFLQLQLSQPSLHVNNQANILATEETDCCEPEENTIQYNITYKSFSMSGFTNRFDSTSWACLTLKNKDLYMDIFLFERYSTKKRVWWKRWWKVKLVWHQMETLWCGVGISPLQFSINSTTK